MSALCTVPSSGSQRWASTTIPVIQSGKVTRVKSSARFPVQGSPIKRPCATTCSHLKPWKAATTNPEKPKTEEISLKRWAPSRELKRFDEAIRFIGNEQLIPGGNSVTVKVAAATFAMNWHSTRKSFTALVLLRHCDRRIAAPSLTGGVHHDETHIDSSHRRACRLLHQHYRRRAG